MGQVNVEISPEVLAQLFFRSDEIGEVTTKVEASTGTIVLGVEHADLPDIDRAVVMVSQRRGLLGQTLTVIDGIRAMGTGGERWEIDGAGHWRRAQERERDDG